MSVRKEVWKKPDGRTIECYRVDVVVTLPDGSTVRDRKASSTWTRRQAEQWERERRAELLNPKPTKKNAPTVATFFDDWIKTDCIARGNRQSTISEKKRDGRLYIVPKLGGLRLDEVNTKTLTGFVAELARAGQSPKTQRNTLATLGRMMRYAWETEEIAAMPRMPRIKVPKTGKVDWYTREEIDQPLSRVTDDAERASLLVGFDAGLRSGEQIALTWGAVSFHQSSAYPHGSITVAEASSRGEVDRTKSGEVRTVPMTSRLAASLRAVRGLRHLDPSSRVFPALDDPWKLDRQLSRASARAELRRLRRHGARHSFASNHVAAGTPLLIVSRWLGHADVTITARIYAHLAPSDGARWLAAYEAPTARRANAAAE